MMDPFLFNPVKLGNDLVQDLRRMNPWWEGKPPQVLPDTRRHLVGRMHASLQRRLAPIILVRGPRQIGKTIVQLQLLQDLLDSGIPARSILCVQLDDLPGLGKLDEPILRLIDWYEGSILCETINQGVRKGEKTYIIEKAVNNAPFGLMIAMTDDAAVADPRIVTLPLSSLMLLQ